MGCAAEASPPWTPLGIGIRPRYDTLFVHYSVHIRSTNCYTYVCIQSSGATLCLQDSARRERIIKISSSASTTRFLGPFSHSRLAPHYRVRCHMYIPAYLHSFTSQDYRNSLRGPAFRRYMYIRTYNIGTYLRTLFVFFLLFSFFLLRTCTFVFPLLPNCPHDQLVD